MIDTNNLYMAISLDEEDVRRWSFSKFGGNPVGIRKNPGGNDEWLFLDGLYGIYEHYSRDSRLIANSVQNKIEKMMNKGIFKGSVKMANSLQGDTFYFEVYQDSEITEEKIGFMEIENEAIAFTGDEGGYHVNFIDIDGYITHDEHYSTWKEVKIACERYIKFDKFRDCRELTI